MNHAIKLFLLSLPLVSLSPCVSVKAGQGCYLVGKTGTWSTPIRFSTHLQIIHSQSSMHASSIHDWSILPSLPIPYETFSSNSLAPRLNLCFFTAFPCFCSTPPTLAVPACHRIASPAMYIFSKAQNPILLSVCSIVQRC